MIIIIIIIMIIIEIVILKIIIIIVINLIIMWLKLYFKRMTQLSQTNVPRDYPIKNNCIYYM
jgi:hypothetical protein